MTAAFIIVGVWCFLAGAWFGLTPYICLKRGVDLFEWRRPSLDNRKNAKRD